MPIDTTIAARGVGAEPLPGYRELLDALTEELRQLRPDIAVALLPRITP